MAGRTSGLLEPEGGEVTWRARHFGVRQTLTSRITAYERPAFFRDSMVRGAFARLDHDHHFSEDGPGGTPAYLRRFLEAEARALGLSRLRLETGVRQPEAIALYERAGVGFGVCMAKNL